MNLKNTKSHDNVINAFAAETQAICKYEIFGEIARDQGHIEIANLFEKMAENEKEHAKIWYKIISDGFKDTMENLKDAIKCESLEWKYVYSSYAKTAREENLEVLAVMFERIASIEYDHERTFMEAMLKVEENINNEKVDKSEEEIFACIFCGYEANKVLETCPECGATDSFSL